MQEGYLRSISTPNTKITYLLFAALHIKIAAKKLTLVFWASPEKFSKRDKPHFDLKDFINFLLSALLEINF